MKIQCSACWTVFDAALAEREPGTRKILCSPCADCGDSVLSREEWTEAEVAEVTPETPARKLQKIDYARIIAEKASQSRRSRTRTLETRAADLASRYKLPYLRAWAATYVAGSAEERETAREAMRAEDPFGINLLGPAPRARLAAEVTEIHRRAAERAASGE